MYFIQMPNMIKILRVIQQGRYLSLTIPLLAIWLMWPSQAVCTDISLSGDRITLHAREVPLISILRELAEQGITVGVDPGINPKITVSLENQDLRLGLNSIIHPYSYALIWKSEKNKLHGSSTLEELRIFKPGNKKRMRYLKPAKRFEVTMNLNNGDKYVRAELLIQISSTTSPARFKQLLKQINGTVIEENRQLGIYRVQVPEDSDIPSLAAHINSTTGIEVEPNFVYASTPPFQLVDTPEPDALSETAPEYRFGDAPVAILDSGLVPGLGIEPFVVASLDPLDPDAPLSDSMGHGTQMAMIATGMITPDGSAEKSADNFVPIIPIRIFDDQGLTSNFTLIQSVDFALQNNARVISLSWGTETHSDFLEQTMDQAYATGTVILAAAGNQPTGTPVYPAAYDSVIGIGALTADGQAWENSNYGSFVTLYAPGVATFPVGNQGKAGTYAGTSISTAHVASAVSTFLTANPQATREQIYNYLGITP
jgi:hypothetical protein